MATRACDFTTSPRFVGWIYKAIRFRAYYLTYNYGLPLSVVFFVFCQSGKRLKGKFQNRKSIKPLRG